MNSEKSNKNKKTKRLKFSWFYYILVGIISFAWRAFMHIKITKSKKYKQLKGAYLIVANHTSSVDIISAVGVVFPKKQNFVVAEKMLYHSKLFARVLTKFGAILKKQFYSDFSCVRNIKKYLDSGTPVLICPEGKVSDDGVTQPIVASTGKLVKWLKYPVVCVVMRGGSLVKPKWANNFRRGKVQIDCDMVLSKEQIEEMSADEINDFLQKALNNNDNIFQQENNIEFKGKNIAEGIEKILYKCPKCGTEFEMESKGNLLNCKKCGNSVCLKNNGTIVAAGEDSVAIKRLDLWYEYEKNCLADEVQKGNFFLEGNVDFYIDDEKTHEFNFVSKGILTINKEKIVFIQNEEKDIQNENKNLDNKTIDKQKNSLDIDNFKIQNATNESPYFQNNTKEDEFFKNLYFKTAEHSTIATTPGTSVLIYENGNIYKFVFVDKKMSTKFALAVEEFAKQ